MSDSTKLSQNKPHTDVTQPVTHPAKDAPTKATDDMKEEALHTVAASHGDVETATKVGSAVKTAASPAANKSAATSKRTPAKTPTAADAATTAATIPHEKTVGETLSDAAHDLGEMAKSAGAAALHAAETAGTAIGNAASAVAHSKPVEAVKDAISHAFSQEDDAAAAAAGTKPSDTLHEIAERTKPATATQTHAAPASQGAAAAETEPIGQQKRSTEACAGTKKSATNKTDAGTVHCATSDMPPGANKDKEKAQKDENEDDNAPVNKEGGTPTRTRRSSNLGHHK